MCDKVVLICLFCAIFVPSVGHHQSNDDRLEDKREDHHDSSVLYCVPWLCAMICIYVGTVNSGDCSFRYRFRVFSADFNSSQVLCMSLVVFEFGCCCQCE